MKSALMVFASDLVDEGFAAVLANARERGGFDGIELAAIYHHARDVHPHNPVHRVRFLDGGAFFFQPRPDAFRGQQIQPYLSPMLERIDPLRELLTVGQEQDLAVRAWAIMLHNFALGERYPDATAENAFGDRLLTDLCPANPDVRVYAATATAELSRTGVEAIVAESICFMPFDHGFHHERTPYPLSEMTRFCLSLCFCAHCLERGRRTGVATGSLRAWMQRELDLALRGEETVIESLPLERETAATLAAGELGGYLAAREETVTSLVGEVTAAVEEAGPARFIFMDSMGASESGEQAGPLVADRSWQFGVDLPAVAAHCHGLSVMGYSREHDRFAQDLERYRAIVPVGTPLSLVARAMPPDCYGTAELRPKLQLAGDLGFEWVECFVYGLMRLEGLDWFREAQVA
jgi:hypothetical protein